MTPSQLGSGGNGRNLQQFGADSGKRFLAVSRRTWHDRDMDPETKRDPQREREEDNRRFTTSLAGLAVALLLIVIGLWLADELSAQSKLEDCVLQGRHDCGTRIELTPMR
jgi:hypothetical protein